MRTGSKSSGKLFLFCLLFSSSMNQDRLQSIKSYYTFLTFMIIVIPEIQFQKHLREASFLRHILLYKSTVSN